MTELDFSLIKEIEQTMPTDEPALNMLIAERVFGWLPMYPEFNSRTVFRPGYSMGFSVPSDFWTESVDSAIDLMSLAAEAKNAALMEQHGSSVVKLRSIMALVIDWTMPSHAGGNTPNAALYNMVMLLEGDLAPKFLATAFLVAWEVLQATLGTERFTLSYIK